MVTALLPQAAAQGLAPGMALADALGVEIAEILEKQQAVDANMNRYENQANIPGRRL